MKVLFLLVGLILAVTAQAASGPARLRFLPNTDGMQYFRSAPDYVDARVLAGSTAESHTVPADVRWLIFSSTCATFYARKNAAAAVPAADVTDGSASERSPTAWFVENLTSIGLIAPEACIITLSFYY